MDDLDEVSLYLGIAVKAIRENENGAKSKLESGFLGGRLYLMPSDFFPPDIRIDFDKLRSKLMARPFRSLSDREAKQFSAGIVSMDKRVKAALKNGKKAAIAKRH